MNVFSKEHRARKPPKVDKPPKQRKPIRPISKKLAKEKETYSKLRLEFLERFENKFCAVYPHLLATEVHHLDGRENWRLNNVDRWLPVSRDGHQWIDDFPELARERGFLGSRLKLVRPLNQE